MDTGRHPTRELHVPSICGSILGLFRGKGVNSVMVTITLAMYTLAAEFT